jgi:hypothetical protein
MQNENITFRSTLLRKAQILGAFTTPSLWSQNWSQLATRSRLVAREAASEAASAAASAAAVAATMAEGSSSSSSGDLGNRPMKRLLLLHAAMAAARHARSPS